MTGIIIYKVFNILQKNKLSNRNKKIDENITYSEFLKIISKNKKINEIIECIVKIFLLVSFYIMVAAFCTYFKQERQIPILISAIVMALLCYITFQKNIQGVFSVNDILIPILIIFVFYLGIKNVPYIKNYFSQIDNTQIAQIINEQQNSKNDNNKKNNSISDKNAKINNKNSNKFGWLISSILYASYNSIVLIPMLIELSKYMNSKRKIKYASIIVTIILIVLGICIFTILLRGISYIKNLELPMLTILKEFGTIYPILYGIVIVVAIFTSCIAAGYSFLNNCTQNKKKYKKIAKIICITSIFIAPIGFSNLVNLGYPVFGILGLIQIGLILKK